MKIDKIKNTIIQGDSIKVMKKFPDNSIDSIITDPPYNTGMTKNKNSTRLSNFFNDSYEKNEYIELVKKTSNNFYRILKENKAGYIFINWKSLSIWLKYLEKAGFNIKNVIVWNKIIHGLNYQNYAYTYELIIFFTKGNFSPNNKSIKDKRKGYYKDVWDIRRSLNHEKDYDHETVKKLEVIRTPIQHSTNKNDIVLDSFLGTGTTAIACKQLERNYIGIELNKKYYKISKKRLNQSNINNYLNKKQNKLK